MDTKTFENPFGSPLVLERYPRPKAEPLQAWDGADELILRHVRETEPPEALKTKRILILNDQFGALGCALAAFDITAYTDSYVSSKAIQLNSHGRVTAVSRLDQLSGVYDLVLLRIPKNMAFFEDILCCLSGLLHSGSMIICGYMLKYEAKASYELLRKYIGETSTSLARKKARLIFAGFQRAKSATPYPKEVLIETFEKPFMHHSNLFSRERLDIGTRLLLGHIPKGDYKVILDLGCANGVVGIAAKRSNPAARVIFSDESRMAVQSARSNYEKLFSNGDDAAEFLWTNCYEGQKPGSVELALCNPPFHQGSAQCDFIAAQMFSDSFGALVRGGLLRVIGNSHLHYEKALKKLFGNSRIVAENGKFTIVDAVKTPG